MYEYIACNSYTYIRVYRLFLFSKLVITIIFLNILNIKASFSNARLPIVQKLFDKNFTIPLLLPNSQLYLIDTRLEKSN